MLTSGRATVRLAVWRLRTEFGLRATRPSTTPCAETDAGRMPHVGARATACGFSTLVVARLPLPQRQDCTGVASGGREHREAADLPEDVLALLDPDLLELGGTSGDPNAGDPIQYDELRIECDQSEVEIVV